MTRPLDPELLAAYLETDYFISDDPPLLMNIGKQNGDLQILLASFGVDQAAFITAWNPRSRKLSGDENDDRQSALLLEIEQLRHNYLVAYGERADWREYSYFVMGISKENASDLAQQFEQNAYVWIDDRGIPELVTLNLPSQV